MIDKVSLILKTLTDARFRRDIRAFGISKAIYIVYAWNFMKEAEIAPLLEKGSTIEDILHKKSLKNRHFLESILDILVGSNVLRYEDGKYFYISPPKEYSDNDKKFLEKFYPYSVKWTERLMKRAKDVLISGKKADDTGFDDDESLDLWDSIMNESPYSFRNFAINLMLKGMKDGSYILNAGCGGGIDIEHILLNTNKRLNIVALDLSEKYIERAKKRMKKLYNNAKSDVIKENIKKIRYVNADILKNNLDGYKFDGIFMCLVLNHIPKNKMPSLMQKLSSTLKDNGKMSIFQILNASKFDRAPIWVMHTVPSHYEYPYKDEYLKILKDNFRKVHAFAKSSIILAEK